MEQHLFVRQPALGYAVLLVLCAFFVWRMIQALRLLEEVPMRQELKAPVEESPQDIDLPVGPRINRALDLLLCVLTGVLLFAVMGVLMWWTDGWRTNEGMADEPPDLFSRQLPLFWGDLLTGGLALILPMSVSYWWALTPKERSQHVLMPVADTQYLGFVILFFQQKNSSLLSTWPVLLSFYALLPLAAFVTWPLLRTHGLRKPTERWEVLFFLGLYALVVVYGAYLLSPEAAVTGLQAGLHDSMGFLALVAFAWVHWFTIRRAIERDGDHAPAGRVSLTGL